MFKFKLDITFPNIFLLLTNSVYVDTSFELTLSSVAVVVEIPKLVELFYDVDNIKLVDELYTGVTKNIV